MAFRREDYVQAVEAAKAAGLTVCRTEIHPDGRIVIHLQDEAVEEEVPWESRVAQAKQEEPVAEPAPIPEVFTPKTLAAFWNCSEATVRNMIRKGSLVNFSLGGKLVRIRAEDVLAYEARHQAIGARGR